MMLQTKITGCISSPVIPAGDTENFKTDSVKLRETPKDMLFDQMIELMGEQRKADGVSKSAFIRR